MIEQRHDEIEEEQTGIPKDQRLTPKEKAVFGPNARRATASDLKMFGVNANG